MTEASQLALGDIRDCLEGALPAAIATAASDGTPNVTYLSKVNFVDDERVALSNQFFSKTARNLAQNPRASVLVIDPNSCDQFRMSVVYERTARRGPVFERLQADLEAVAAVQGMQGVFKLRAADIYRVVSIEPLLAAVHHHGDTAAPPPISESNLDAEGVAALSATLSRCQDLNTLVDTTLAALAEIFGYEHSQLLLLDEEGTHLYTIASHGYDAEGVGSELAVGAGIIGLAATRCAPVRIGNALQIAQYAKVVRQAYEDSGLIEPGRSIPTPGLPRAKSRIAVPAMALGDLVGVLTAESLEPVAFDAADEAILTTAASLVANAIEVLKAREAADTGPTTSVVAVTAPRVQAAATLHVRFFPVDGSTFIDGDYLIRGVAGRILWSLLGEHERSGRLEFTNREVRLDPALELPSFRDNFEGRLILLKRRLDEKASPIRIDKTGRGRFRLHVNRALRLEVAGVPTD